MLSVHWPGLCDDASQSPLCNRDEGSQGGRTEALPHSHIELCQNLNTPERVWSSEGNCIFLPGSAGPRDQGPGVGREGRIRRKKKKQKNQKEEEEGNGIGRRGGRGAAG